MRLDPRNAGKKFCDSRAYGSEVTGQNVKVVITAPPSGRSVQFFWFLLAVKDLNLRAKFGSCSFCSFSAPNSFSAAEQEQESEQKQPDEPRIKQKVYRRRSRVRGQGQHSTVESGVRGQGSWNRVE